jgi:hypothetical protein
MLCFTASQPLFAPQITLPRLSQLLLCHDPAQLAQLQQQLLAILVGSGMFASFTSKPGCFAPDAPLAHLSRLLLCHNPA